MAKKNKTAARPPAIVIADPMALALWNRLAEFHAIGDNNSDAAVFVSTIAALTKLCGDIADGTRPIMEATKAGAVFDNSIMEFTPLITDLIIYGRRLGIG